MVVVVANSATVVVTVVIVSADVVDVANGVTVDIIPFFVLALLLVLLLMLSKNGADGYEES